MVEYADKKQMSKSNDNKKASIKSTVQRSTLKQPILRKENNTGLPDNLKSGVENLSGYSMDDVKVHYNSDKPAQLNAHAYAQGSDIHLASGQEKHLPHEAWHVVQQKQGRVKPTMQMKDKVNINDDAGLEREADMMGAKALQVKSVEPIVQKMNIEEEEELLQGVFAQEPSKITQGSVNEIIQQHIKTQYISSTNDTVAQPKWIDVEESEFYKWDAMTDGVRWFHHKKKDLMYYMVEDLETAGDGVQAYAGIKNVRPRSVWLDMSGGVDVMIDEDASIIESEESQKIASKDDHEALIAQFEDLSSTGGLLMHAVANGEDVESIGYLVERGLSLNEIRKGDFRTKLLSYIRSDLTMKTFGFRKMGLLVDWKRIWHVIGYKQGMATIYEEDQQSSRKALDKAESYGEAGGDIDLMGSEFDAMAKRQNKLKMKSQIGNWNEILSYNAVTAGVVGLLWVRDESKNDGNDGYDQFFTEEKKQQLYVAWTKKTGMEVMPIYVYTHMGNPARKKEKSEARERLGKKGASSLKLKEKYKPKK